MNHVTEFLGTADLSSSTSEEAKYSNQHNSDLALNSRLQLVFDNVPIGLFHLDKDNSIDFENDAVSSILGTRLSSYNSLLHVVRHTRIHSADKYHIFENLRPFIKSNRSLNIRFRITSPRSLSFKWIRLRTIPEFDNKLSYQGASGIVEDITEHITPGPSQLIQRLQHIIDKIDYSILICDAQGKIRALNLKFTELSGYKKSELLGQSLDSLDPAENKGTLRNYLRNYFEPMLKKPKHEEQLLARNHALVPVEISITSTTIDSTLTVFSFQDLRHRKLSELKVLQSQKLDTMSKLAAGAVHDFNNALAIIQGNVEMLGDHISEEKYDLIELTQIAINKCAMLARGLLGFTRQPADDNPDIINLSNTIKNTGYLIVSTLHKNIEFKIDYGSTAGYVRVDSEKLSNVLMNLILNARDAMPKGGLLRLAVEQVELDADTKQLNKGKYLCISIFDTGTGMSKACRCRCQR